MAESNIKSHAFILSDFKVDYYLAADDEQTKKYWMHSLIQVIRKIQQRVPSPSGLFQMRVLGSNSLRTREEVKRDYERRLANYNNAGGIMNGLKPNYIRDHDFPTVEVQTETFEVDSMAQSQTRSAESKEPRLDSFQTDLMATLSQRQAEEKVAREGSEKLRSLDTASRFLDMISLCTFDEEDKPMLNRTQSISSLDTNVWFDLRRMSREPSAASRQNPDPHKVEYASEKLYLTPTSQLPNSQSESEASREPTDNSPNPSISQEEANDDVNDIKHTLRNLRIFQERQSKQIGKAKNI